MSEFNAGNAGLLFSNAVADAVERAGSATVLVNARRRLPSSGLVFGPDLVLTANHTVERDEDIQVVLPDGREAGASLAGRDSGTDLAVLRLQGQGGLAPVRPGEQGVRIGHLVVAVGRPSREGIQASLGMVNALGGGLRTRRGVVLERYILTDAVPYPGFSGGPLVDLGGSLVGINTSGLVRGTSLAIPAALAWEVAQTLAQHGHVRRGYLGIRSQQVELPAQSSLGREQATGLLVVGIEPEGPADGKLMVGDILVGLAGQPVADHDDLITRLSGDVVGRPAEVQVLRGGQLQTVSITVGDRQ